MLWRKWFSPLHHVIQKCLLLLFYLLLLLLYLHVQLSISNVTLVGMLRWLLSFAWAILLYLGLAIHVCCRNLSHSRCGLRVAGFFTSVLFIQVFLLHEVLGCARNLISRGKSWFRSWGPWADWSPSCWVLRSVPQLCVQARLLSVLILRAPRLEGRWVLRLHLKSILIHTTP